jgi:hypothetical protein
VNDRSFLGHSVWACVVLATLLFGACKVGSEQGQRDESGSTLRLEVLARGDSGSTRRVRALSGEMTDLVVASSFVPECDDFEFVPANRTARIGEYVTGVDTLAVALSQTVHDDLLAWAIQRSEEWIVFVLNDQMVYTSTPFSLASGLHDDLGSSAIVIPLYKPGTDLSARIAGLLRVAQTE